MARNRLLPAPPAARRLSVLALLVLCITAWNLNAASAAADAGGAKDWSNEKQGVHVLNVTNFDSSLRDGKVWLIEVRRFRFWKVPMKRSGPDCIRPPRPTACCAMLSNDQFFAHPAVLRSMVSSPRLSMLAMDIIRR